MINRFITWLRRDDERLDILRKQIEQQEKQVDWENLQKAIIYLILGTATVGFGVMFAMWITL